MRNLQMMQALDLNRNRELGLFQQQSWSCLQMILYEYCWWDVFKICASKWNRVNKVDGYIAVCLLLLLILYLSASSTSQFLIDSHSLKERFITMCLAISYQASCSWFPRELLDT
jgi:hypothetical protein